MTILASSHDLSITNLQIQIVVLTQQLQESQDGFHNADGWAHLHLCLTHVHKALCRLQ